MKYTQLVESIVPNSVLTFKEYELDRHERKRLTYEIGPAPVECVVLPNQPLCRADLEKYYGSELSDLDYCQLACMSDFRFILRVGIDEENQPVYKPILINQDFFNMGLQTVELISVPNYGGVCYGSHYSSR